MAARRSSRRHAHRWTPTSSTWIARLESLPATILGTRRWSSCGSSADCARPKSRRRSAFRSAPSNATGSSREPGCRMKSAGSDQGLDPARIEAVFHEAADLEQAEQAAYLARACGGDVRLESAVRALLDAGRNAATVWDRSALELEARHSALAAHTPRPDE